MIFSVYVLRNDPDYCVFDVEVGDPPVGQRHEYDCAGVFEVDGAVFDLQGFAFAYTDNGCILGVIDDWKLNAQAVLCGDFTDAATKNTAPIKRLW